MVSLSPELDPRDAAALREDAAAIDQAVVEMRRQLALLGNHPNEHLPATIHLGTTPLRLTLRRSVILADHTRWLAQLDDIAAGFRAQAREIETFGRLGHGISPVGMPVGGGGIGR